MKAYLAGKQAWEDQKSRNSCPYSKADSELRRKWLDGWNVAMEMSLGLGADRRKEGDRLTF
jgi:ribosome modulation factor